MTHRILAGLLAAALLAPLVPAPAGASEKELYTLVYLKTGPQNGKLDEAATKAAFAGHFSNMQRLAEERKLLVAGPFGQQRHDESLRGVFVLATGKREEAEAWAATDPTTQAGVFVLDFHAIATDFPFRQTLEKHFAREEKARQDKVELKLEDTMRGYVWLLAEDREKALHELAPLLGEKKVLLVADYDGKGLLALLDSASLEQAKERFGETLAKLGPYQLDEWYATNLLAIP